jgi:hypothetical protein
MESVDQTNVTTNGNNDTATAGSHYTVTPSGAVPTTAPAADMPYDYSADAAKAFSSAPWSVVSEDGTLPEQFYNFKITESYPGDDGNEDPALAKIKWVIVVEVTAPQESAGRIKTENFFVGTDNDPKASNPSTWANSFAATNLRKLCTFLGCAENPQALVGKEFGAFTNTTTSRDRRYSNISWHKLFHVNEVSPGTPTEKRAGAARFKRSTAQVAAAGVSSPADELPCPKCRQSIRRDAMIDHVRGCTTSSVSV